MAETETIDMMAAEYVLGTLDRDERTHVALTRTTDKALDHAIKDWEWRLAPLADALPDMQPAAGLFATIEKRISSMPSRTVPAYWRQCAIAASLALVCITGLLITQLNKATHVPQFYASLQKDAAGPTFLIGFDATSTTLTVSTVAATPPSGKSYELWMVAEGSAPKSMGVVNPNDQKSVHLENVNAATVENAAFAISIEPAGGSPTGAPTGPVVYSGKLVRKI